VSFPLLTNVLGTDTRFQGRAFAWQESLINVALIVQRFDLALADPAYELQLQSTLTIKPMNFHIRASLRPGRQSLCFVPLAAM
jgi:cytochrome P450/NADPH-cytochrome P450 reductase